MQSSTETNTISEKCVYGDHPAQRYQSGRPICHVGWQWNKLDLPAANHWAVVAEMFLSNVDMYDLRTYLPACGVSHIKYPSTGTSEVFTVLDGARRILEHSQEVQKGSPCSGSVSLSA